MSKPIKPSKNQGDRRNDVRWMMDEGRCQKADV